MLKEPHDEESEHFIKNGPGCWDRMFYNTKFQIVLVLVLCAFIGIGTPFIWQLIWSITPDCCGIESDLRYDCFPFKETKFKNQSFCKDTAKCCWDNNTAPDQIQCYYGIVSNKDASTKMPGYSIINSTSDGAELQVDTVPNFINLGNTDNTVGPIVRHYLSVKVEHFNKDHFHVKISSPEDNGYDLHKEFDALKPNLLSNNESEAIISLKSKSNASTFSLSVTRRETGHKIFNSGDFSPFIYTKGYIEITTLLPNDLIYGLGQSPSKSFKHNMTYPEHWQIFSKYNLNLTTNQSSWFGSHPFYMGWTNDDKAYGILLLNSYPLQLITNSRPSLTFRTIGGPLDFHFFLGPTPSQVMKQLIELIGKPSLPPYWALGFHMCRTNSDLNNPENGAETIVKNMRALKIPFDSDCGSAALSTDIDKSGKDSFDILSANVLKEYYKMLKDPTVLGNVKALLVQVPHRPTNGSWQGAALRKPDGTKYEGRFYNWLVMDSDTKNPNITVIYPSFESYPGRLASDHLMFGNDIEGTFLDYNTPLDLSSTRGLNMSVLCPTLIGNNTWNKYYYWKLNEFTPCLDSFDPMEPSIDPLSTHNLYGHRHMKASKSALEQSTELNNGKRKLVMSLSTFLGDGALGGHIGTNMNATWDMLLQSHIQTLEFNMYGIPLVGFPVCGFKGEASDEELCLRWYQLAALQPFMISHRGFGEKLTDPYSVTKSKTTQEALKNSIVIRYSLLPYLYTLFYKANRYGDPVVRPLFYDFPEDTKTFRIDKQYLLGSALMASPVTKQKVNSVEAYFPKDPDHEKGSVWYDYYSGRRIAAKEGHKFNLSAIEYHINLHLRGGYVIPTQTPGNNTVESRKNPFTLIAALDLNRHAEGDLYLDDGISINTENNITSEFIAEENSFTISTNASDRVNWGLLNNPQIDVIKIFGIIDGLNPEWFLVQGCGMTQACVLLANKTKENHDYIHVPYTGVLTMRNLNIKLNQYEKFIVSWNYQKYS